MKHAEKAIKGDVPSTKMLFEHAITHDEGDDQGANGTNARDELMARLDAISRRVK